MFFVHVYHCAKLRYNALHAFHQKFCVPLSIRCRTIQNIFTTYRLSRLLERFRRPKGCHPGAQHHSPAKSIQPLRLHSLSNCQLIPKANPTEKLFHVPFASRAASFSANHRECGISEKKRDVFFSRSLFPSLRSRDDEEDQWLGLVNQYNCWIQCLPLISSFMDEEKASSSGFAWKSGKGKQPVKRERITKRKPASKTIDLKSICH